MSMGHELYCWREGVDSATFSLLILRQHCCCAGAGKLDRFGPYLERLKLEPFGGLGI